MRRQATTKIRGQPKTSPGRIRYLDLLIQTLLTLRHTLRMTFHSAQGMAQGLVKWTQHQLPSLTTVVYVSEYQPLPKLSKHRPSLLLVESSGLKLYGCEKWLHLSHNIKIKSRWITVHTSLDAASQEVIGYKITRACPHFNLSQIRVQAM